MICNLEQIQPKERIEPPVDELKKAFDFYYQRLYDHGYKVRDQHSYREIAEYFALFYMSIRHETPKFLNAEDNTVYSKPKYGMLLYGPNGSGKTMALAIFSSIFKINFVYMDELITEYGKRGEQGFWDYSEQFNNQDLILDDAGNERELKSFGNASPIIDFFYKRERMFKDSGVLTHLSTNKQEIKDLIGVYGSRAVSRITGMTHSILIDAEDMRQDKEDILNLT